MVLVITLGSLRENKCPYLPAEYVLGLKQRGTFEMCAWKVNFFAGQKVVYLISG